MTKQRILITASTYPRWDNDATPGFVEQFAKNIKRRNTDVYVIAPHAYGAKKNEVKDGVVIHRYHYFIPPKAQTIMYDGGAVNKINKTPTYAVKVVLLLVSQFLNVLRLTYTNKITVINAHWAIPQGFVAVFVKIITGKKIVLTVHGGDIFNLNGKIMTAVKKFVLKHSDVVCPNSEATMLACKSIYDRSYEIIPMGIYMDKFTVQSPSIELKKAHSVKGFTMLYVGRLADVKGVKYLLEAATILKQKGKEFTVIIVGEGPLRNEFRQYIDMNGLETYVHLVGWVSSDQLNEYYSIADLFVGPSLSEPQGLVFVEALATGTPVLATKVGGIPGIVTNGVTGYLVPPKSAKKIAEKVEYLIDNPKILAHMADTARNSVVNKFSWENTTARYEEIFSRFTS